jgi:hypothetical protein
MYAQIHRLGSVIALTAVACGWPAAAAMAQPASQGAAADVSLADVAARVPVGQVVYVTDGTGATTKGRLGEAVAEAVQIHVGTTVRIVAAADIRRIEWEKPDSPLTGMLIGAGIGAIPGMYWLIADPNECTGMCPEEYMLIAAGAAIGGLIDGVVRKKVPVYDAGVPRGRGTTVTFHPFAHRERSGLLVAVRF